MKKFRKNLIFDGTSGLNWVLKLEMRSYSDNAYDVTILCCFEKLLAYTLFLPSCIAVRDQMAELNWGGGGGEIGKGAFWRSFDHFQTRSTQGIAKYES